MFLPMWTVAAARDRLVKNFPFFDSGTKLSLGSWYGWKQCFRLQIHNENFDKHFRNNISIWVNSIIFNYFEKKGWIRNLTVINITCLTTYLPQCLIETCQGKTALAAFSGNKKFSEKRKLLSWCRLYYSLTHSVQSSRQILLKSFILWS